MRLNNIKSLRVFALVITSVWVWKEICSTVIAIEIPSHEELINTPPWIIKKELGEKILKPIEDIIKEVISPISIISGGYLTRICTERLTTKTAFETITHISEKINNLHNLNNEGMDIRPEEILEVAEITTKLSKEAVLTKLWLSSRKDHKSTYLDKLGVIIRAEKALETRITKEDTAIVYLQTRTTKEYILALRYSNIKIEKVRWKLVDKVTDPIVVRLGGCEWDYKIPLGGTREYVEIKGYVINRNKHPSRTVELFQIKDLW